MSTMHQTQFNLIFLLVPKFGVSEIHFLCFEIFRMLHLLSVEAVPTLLDELLHLACMLLSLIICYKKVDKYIVCAKGYIVLDDTPHVVAGLLSAIKEKKI
jgi:hypothetical protein